GGSKSHEFQVLASSGEDAILACDSCEYAANIEKAEVKKQEVKSASKEKGKYKKIATPGKGSIEEVSGFLKKSANEFVKTLLFETDQGPIAVLLRGDHELMEAKLQVATAAKWCHLAEDKTVQEITKAKAGFSGPIGLTLPVYADYAVESMSNFVVGANETDMHFTEANLSDFEVKGFFDLRAAQEGNACARCEKGKYEMHRGIEVGQVFYLGTKYSESMNAVYLDENQKKQFIEMGCYGIGIGRTAAAAIEQNHDERGIIWPKAIAPFQFHLISLAEPGSKAHVFAEELHKQLEAKGMEVLFDERKARAGVKFADADLIGIPYQITIGEKGLEKQIVECKARQTGEKSEFSVHGLLDHLLSLYT
ncbi:MAG: proline--tRNA ligase, partial [Deltaproteobacteria bacterium CG11_big_fil_rev_8_21_14_0_20_42_23]